MAGEFTFDISRLLRALNGSDEAIARGLQKGLTDVKNDWRAEAVDVAPIDTGNLRQQITSEVFVHGNEHGVEISANATRGNFNYAYYIHEGNGNVQTGEKKFLDVSAQQNEAKWQRWLEEELRNEIAREWGR